MTLHSIWNDCEGLVCLGYGVEVTHMWDYISYKEYPKRSGR